MPRPEYTVSVDWDLDDDHSDPGETLTNVAGRDRVLARGGLKVQYGRDQARALAPTAVGQATLEVDNRSGDYNPENDSSPLAGNVRSGRPLRIQAIHNSVTYGLFTGYLDDFDVLPDLEEQSVRLSALDELGRFRGVQISTALHDGIRTGAAIGHVLDAVGWPAAARDLDPGATHIRWWWEDRTDAFQAIQNLLLSEGPPALITVDPSGIIVFRDRHHRLLRAASLVPQATLNGSPGIGATVAPHPVYDHGWRDIISSVTFAVDTRQVQESQPVWTSEEVFTVAAGDTRAITAEATDPFIYAHTPAADTDYVVVSGSATVTLSRDAAASATIRITASTGGDVVIQGMQLRAQPVAVTRTTQIHAEDSASIEAHGRRDWPNDAPWVNEHDARAVAEAILARRANRLPVISVRLVGYDDTNLVQQLGRDLSDRVTINIPELVLDDDFHIEQIQHTSDGVTHQTVFGCEKAPVIPGNVFRFDTTGAGFNDGVFAAQGLDDPDTIFLLDGGSGHRFDEGVFAT